jgi:hypothetical protein
MAHHIITRIKKYEIKEIGHFINNLYFPIA